MFQIVLKLLVIICFLFNTSVVYSQQKFLDPHIPVSINREMSSIVLQGLRLDKNNPLNIDLIIAENNFKQEIFKNLDDDALGKEIQKIINYFFTSLITPEEDMWVNLSPYESDRIIPEVFGKTEMGVVLLQQDYLLKQLTSMVLSPNSELGQEMWDNVYSEIYKEHGSLDIPIEILNKIWIVPSKVKIFENPEEMSVFIVESEFNVLMEEDYISKKMNSGFIKEKEEAYGSIAVQKIIKDHVLPHVKNYVNSHKSFEPLRQAMNSLILARWYKQLLHQLSLDHLVDNIDFLPKNINNNEKISGIYENYLQIFEQQEKDQIYEFYDPVSQNFSKRKYVSGGVLPMKNLNLSKVAIFPMFLSSDSAALGVNLKFSDSVRGAFIKEKSFDNFQKKDFAMMVPSDAFLALFMGFLFLNAIISFVFFLGSTTADIPESKITSYRRWRVGAFGWASIILIGYWQSLYIPDSILYDQDVGVMLGAIITFLAILPQIIIWQKKRHYKSAFKNKPRNSEKSDSAELALVEKKLWKKGGIDFGHTSEIRVAKNFFDLKKIPSKIVRNLKKVKPFIQSPYQIYFSELKALLGAVTR